MSQFSPKLNYLLLEEIEESGKSSGGIIIPQAFRQKLNMGKILEFGPLVDQKEMFLKVGEIVVFPFHVEYRVHSKEDNKTYIFVPADQIMAGDNCTTK